MERKLVSIEWLDSKGITHEWEYLDEIAPLLPSKCVSVGFLLEETEGYKTIAQSLSDTQVLGRTTIPCCAIQKVIKLRAFHPETPSYSAAEATEGVVLPPV